MKRCAVIIMMCLLLGAIINVAVAWWLAMRKLPVTGMTPGESRQCYHDGRSAYMIAKSVGVLSATEQLDRSGFVREMRRRLPQITSADFYSSLPGCSALREGPMLPRINHPAAMYATLTFKETFAGWPCLTLFSTHLRVPSDYEIDGYERRTGLLALPEAWLPNKWSTEVPFTPCWAGFAINTALYALCVWVPFFLPRIARTCFRKRRGCCTACGYDLRGAAHTQCPECGGQVPQSVAPMMGANP